MARKKKPTEPQSPLTATVFVRRGAVRAGEILAAALEAVRDQIPLGAMNVKPIITDASEIKTTGNGTEGRDYTVTITWTDRRRADDEDEPTGTVDQVIESLEPLTPEKFAAATDTAPPA